MTPEASDNTGDDPVYEAAAVWVARLFSSDATDDDRKAFEAWRAADPAHAEVYAEMEEWRRAMGQIADPRRRNRGKPKGLAVVAALGLSGMIAHHFGLIDRLRADAWTPVGAIVTTTLTDGSRVDLNTDTALALRFTDRERGVALLRGEAVFDVVPDPGRPFVVRGDRMRVRAVGTRFFVRVDGGADPVGVTEGRVDVSTPVGDAAIGVGEVARRDPNDRLIAQRSDVERAIAWRQGKLIFSGHPLSAVLAELQRYRVGRIVLLDSAIGTRRFSGTLDPRSTDDALEVLAATMGVRVTRLTPLLVLVRSAS